jgi:shikimate 5-dehydrogenase
MTSVPAPASVPTMYFIGVTTAKSSINRIFPEWAAFLGLGTCALRGIDFALHDDPARYREAVDFIKKDRLSLGALVTTHKIDLCTACRDQFDHLEPLSAAMGEVSSIYKRNGTLHGRAADPWTVGYSLDSFLSTAYWENGAEVLILGAGGSAVALAWHLTKSHYGFTHPRRIHVANRSAPRLRHLEELHASWKTPVPLSCHHVPQAQDADALLAQLPPGSLIVNATGLGKDAPGSPITHAARFPEHGVVWEFNYRGDLVFLDQARAQQSARHLRIEDGWTYFIHGWTRVISDVFEREIPTSGPVFEKLSQIASATR